MEKVNILCFNCKKDFLLELKNQPDFTLDIWHRSDPVKSKHEKNYTFITHEYNGCCLSPFRGEFVEICPHCKEENLVIPVRKSDV
jgi:hypothetical protein